MKPFLAIICMNLGFCQSINFKQEAKDRLNTIPYFEITLYHYEW